MNQNTLPLNQLRDIRIDKLKKISDLGINTYPSKSERTHIINQLKENFADFENTKVVVAGRIMSWREHGQLIFFDLMDGSGKIQIYVKADSLTVAKNALAFEDLKLLDLGDFVEIDGVVTKTQRGEISVAPNTIKLLTKSIRPLPSVHFGLKDEEERFRQRYVDFILNPELREMFVKKSRFWNSMREFMVSKGFLEVETPVLENTAGGADAAPFITHHNSLDIDVYLRISMGELWQKRLMVGMFEKTFEIGRQFRNEGMSKEHLQDYSQMEFYWAYANFEDSMRLVVELYRHIAFETFGSYEFEINGFQVDFRKEWARLDYRSAILDNLKIDISDATIDQMRAKLKELKVEFTPNDDKPRLIDLLWKQVRKSIAGPVFLINHPVEVSPLAKRKPENPEFVERYQIILAGSEMGNGYSELNDPIDQAERFKKQQAMRDAGDDEAQMADYDFVRALEYGMPPVTGFGVSERLFSFLMNKPVRECVMFPLLRPEFENQEKVTLKKPIQSKTTSSADFIVDINLKNKYGELFFAYTEIKDVDIKKSSKELEELKDNIFKDLKLSDDYTKEFPSVNAYREIFRKSGVDYHSKKPSPDALLKRVQTGKGIYSINTAVDAYNLAVISTGIGLGGMDLEEVEFPVQLRLSRDGDQVKLIGEDQSENVPKSHIVYADNKSVLSLHVNYRDSDRTKITEKTKNIILFADGVPGIKEEKVLEALKLGAEYIQKFCGGTIGEINLIK